MEDNFTCVSNLSPLLHSKRSGSVTITYTKNVTKAAQRIFLLAVLGIV